MRTATLNHEIVVYQDSVNYFRWKIVSPSGKLIGESQEGFVHRVDCVNNLRMMYTAMHDLFNALPKKEIQQFRQQFVPETSEGRIF